MCSHQNRRRAKVGVAKETRRSNLGGIPPPKSERVRRTWIPTTSLIRRGIFPNEPAGTALSQNFISLLNKGCVPSKASSSKSHEVFQLGDTAFLLLVLRLCQVEETLVDESQHRRSP